MSNKIKPLIVEINNREKLLSSLKDQEFKEKTHLLKKQVLGGVNIDKLILEDLDEDRIALNNKYDLIVSFLSLHYRNDFIDVHHGWFNK